MEQIAQLLKPELLTVGGALVIVLQVVWKVFYEAKALPTIPKWLVPLAMVPLALGLAWREHVIHPADPAATKLLADEWIVQGLFLLGIMYAGWLGMTAAFAPPAAGATKAQNGTLQPRLGAFWILVALTAFLAASPSVVAAQTETDSLSAFSLTRLAGGIQVGGVIHDDGDAPDLSAGIGRAGLSYNLGLLSLVAYAQGEPSEAERVQVGFGGRAALAQIGREGRVQLAVGVDYCLFRGAGYDALEAQRQAQGLPWEREAVKVSTRLSAVLLATRAGRGVLGVQVPIEYTATNGQLDVAALLSVQLFGGAR